MRVGVESVWMTAKEQGQLSARRAKGRESGRTSVLVAGLDAVLDARRLVALDDELLDGELLDERFDGLARRRLGADKEPDVLALGEAGHMLEGEGDKVGREDEA